MFIRAPHHLPTFLLILCCICLSILSPPPFPFPSLLVVAPPPPGTPTPSQALLVEFGGSLCPSPYSILTTGKNGTVIAGCSGSRGVYMFNVPAANGGDGNGVRLGGQQDCTNPTDLIFKPDPNNNTTLGGNLYVSCFSQGVFMYNGTGYTRIDPVTAQCSEANALTMSGDWIWAACGDAGVRLLSLKNSTESHAIGGQSCGGATDVIHSEVDENVYAICSSGINAWNQTGDVFFPIAQGACSSPTFLASGHQTGVLFASCSSGVFRVNASEAILAHDSTKTIITQLVDSSGQQNPCSFLGPLVVSEEETVYVVCMNSGGVLSINGTSGEVQSKMTLPFTCDPVSIALPIPPSTLPYVGCNGNAPSGGVGVPACADATQTVFSSDGYPIACEWCQDGYTNDQSTPHNQPCQPCGTGRYSNWTSGLQCEFCPSGHYQDDTGKDYCKVCGAGAVCGEPGCTTCGKCSKGAYSNTTTECVPCVAGRYAANEGQAECTKCSPGSYGTVSGATEPLYCASCPAGRHGLDSAATTCYDCEAGTYAPSAGLRQCTRCPSGTYQDESGQYSCKDCPTNHYGEQQGANSIAACLPCPIDAPFAPAGSSSISQCVPPVCGVGNYSLPGQEPCTGICPPGAYCTSGQMLLCSPGTANDKSGSWLSTDCESCSAGTFAQNSGSFTCLPCSPGYYQPQTASRGCLPCPTNHYQPVQGATDVKQCTACPDSTPFSPAASVDILQCLPLRCEGGNYTAPLQPACSTPCPAGSYCQSGVVQPCPPGRAAEKTGSQSIADCIQCVPGRYASTSGLASCNPCEMGYFQPQPGQSLCFPCPSDTFNEVTGATSESACQPCPLATPASPPASTSFLQCTAPICLDGRYTANVSAPCGALCQSGHYCSGGQRQPCPAGRYMNTTGAAKCDPCSIGRYSAVVGSSTVDNCVACPEFSWSNEEGAALCTLCPVGSIANRTGATDPSACQPQPCLTSTSLDTLALAASVQNGSSDAISAAQLCLYGSASPVALASVMPIGLKLLAEFMTKVNETNTERLVQQQQGDGTTTTNSSSSGSGSGSSSSSPLLLTPSEAYSLYTASRTATSLRIHAFGSDDVLNRYASEADGGAIVKRAADGESTLRDRVPPGAIIAIVVGIFTLAILPVTLYRLLPARLALFVDQFSLNDRIKVGEGPTRSPTQFGAAITLCFICIACLLGLYLATAPNTSTNTALLPPSAVTDPAEADMEITLRIHSGEESTSQYCADSGDASVPWYDSSLVSSQSGLSQPFTIRTHPAGGICSIAADCQQCSLTTPLAALAFNLPASAQFIEWEVWVAAAQPRASARRYGVLSQLPGLLRDESGRLTLSAIQSYYTDRTGDTTIEKSGYEIDFGGYSIVQIQSNATFTESSRVELSVELEKSPIIFQTTVTNKLSTIQILAAVLSAIISLFSVFAIMVAICKGYFLPHLHLIPGRVVDERAQGGDVYILQDSKSDAHARKLVRMRSLRTIAMEEKGQDAIELCEINVKRKNSHDADDHDPPPVLNTASPTATSPDAAPEPPSLISCIISPSGGGDGNGNGNEYDFVRIEFVPPPPPSAVQSAQVHPLCGSPSMDDMADKGKKKRKKHREKTNRQKSGVSSSSSSSDSSSDSTSSSSSSSASSRSSSDSSHGSASSSDGEEGEGSSRRHRRMRKHRHHQSDRYFDENLGEYVPFDAHSAQEAEERRKKAMAVNMSNVTGLPLRFGAENGKRVVVHPNVLQHPQTSISSPDAPSVPIPPRTSAAYRSVDMSSTYVPSLPPNSSSATAQQLEDERRQLIAQQRESMWRSPEEEEKSKRHREMEPKDAAQLLAAINKGQKVQSRSSQRISAQAMNTAAVPLTDARRGSMGVQKLQTVRGLGPMVTSPHSAHSNIHTNPSMRGSLTPRQSIQRGSLVPASFSAQTPRPSDAALSARPSVQQASILRSSIDSARGSVADSGNRWRSPHDNPYMQLDRSMHDPATIASLARPITFTQTMKDAAAARGQRTDNGSGSGSVSATPRGSASVRMHVHDNNQATPRGSQSARGSRAYY